MARPVPLPKISECFAPAPMAVSLNDRRIMQALIAFLSIAALSVGHIYLKFLNQDMKVQQRQYQEQSRVLQREIDRLEKETAALCDGARLREFGLRDMQMVEDNVALRQVAVLPANISDKYMRSEAGDRMIASASEAVEQPASPVKQILLSVVDAKAFAGESEN